METRADLFKKIVMIEEANKILQQKIDDQRHLAEAVNVKDKEISKLKEQINSNFRTQNEEKDKVIKTQVEEKDKIIKMLATTLQMYQQSFRAFLKNVQGGLENAVEVEAMITDQLNNRK